MTVRAPREDDAEPLARVHERGWTISHVAHGADPSWLTGRTWEERVAEWRGFCRGEGRPMWVAEQEGEIVGFAAAGRREDGFTRATLWTFTSAPQARAFYEARGWASDGTVKDDPRGEHLRYERAL